METPPHPGRSRGSTIDIFNCRHKLGNGVGIADVADVAVADLGVEPDINITRTDGSVVEGLPVESDGNRKQNGDAGVADIVGVVVVVVVCVVGIFLGFVWSCRDAIPTRSGSGVRCGARRGSFYNGRTSPSRAAPGRTRRGKSGGGKRRLISATP